MWRDLILPKLGAKPVDEIEFADVERLHRSIAAPYRANRTYETLRRVLNLCIKWGWIDRNPAKGLEVNRETPRNKYLTRGSGAGDPGGVCRRPNPATRSGCCC